MLRPLLLTPSHAKKIKGEVKSVAMTLSMSLNCNGLILDPAKTGEIVSGQRYIDEVVVSSALGIQCPLGCNRSGDTNKRSEENTKQNKNDYEGFDLKHGVVS